MGRYLKFHFLFVLLFVVSSALGIDTVLDKVQPQPQPQPQAQAQSSSEFELDIESLKELNKELRVNEKANEGDVYVHKKVFLENILNYVANDKPIFFDKEKITANLEQLTSKMSANESYGYDVAYIRDELEVTYINNTVEFFEGMNHLIKLRNSYISQKGLRNYIETIKKNIKNAPLEKKFDDYYNNNKNIDAKLYDELRLNYSIYKTDVLTYLEILNYLSNNSNKIEKTNFLVSKFNLEYWIKLINSNDLVENINIYLNFYLQVDIGSILLATLFFLIINSLIVFVMPLMITVVQKGQSNQATKRKNTLIKRFLTNAFYSPIRFYLLIFSIELFFEIIHKGQFNISKVETFINIAYIINSGYLVYNIFDEWINNFSEIFFERHANVRKEMVGFLLKLFTFILVIIVTLFILTELEFDVKAILASLGIGGIAIAFAAKETVSNLFSSVNLMLDNSFSQGDWIVTDTYEGTVIELKMRTTTIRTFDNALVSIPNSLLASSSIKNWSKRVIGRRIKMNIGVTYESNFEDIRQALIDIEQMLLNHPDIASKKTNIDGVTTNVKLAKKEDILGIKRDILVYLDAFSESSVDILVYCFSRTTNWSEWLSVKEDVMFKLAEIIKTNHLEFAYPTQVTHFKR
ncbi:MAG: mechanosensitive ion channel family protein [Candidatus Marinarcus sp.]|uniref:mechanosensitive ion channel family protein n=1 Tax=Candidatus Marinarcus sp. TaxID=3100987 RepID=UPI003B00FBB9